MGACFYSEHQLYLHLDHLGTPQALSNASGQIVWQAVYEPFGKMTAVASGIPVNEKIRFPGQYYDSESGLHQNWWRDYSPKTGRYLQGDPLGLDGGLNLYSYLEADPIGLKGGLNLFAYVHDNPVSSSDFLGLLEKCVNASSSTYVGIRAILHHKPSA